MKIRVFPSFRLLAAVVLLFSAGCAIRPELKPGRTRLDTRLIVVPARVIGSQFVVEARWDKRGPWHFLVDTGSLGTLVSPELARWYATGRAALNAPSVRVTSPDGKAMLLPSVTIQSIALGDARFENVQALVYDCSELSAHLGVKIDGILGFPLFRETIFTLDYPQSRLVITPPAEVSYLPGATVKFNNTRRIPLIPIRVGDISLVALIDSGSDAALQLNPLGLNLSFASGPRPGAIISNLAGDRVQEIGRLAQPVALGQYTFPSPVVDLADQLSVVGANILRNFTVTFDQGRNQVTFFRETTAPIAMEPVRSSGLSVSKAAAYWRVVGVVPGSPADDAGVRSGDLITRINGESVSMWPLQRYEGLLKEAAEITFTFLDGAKENPIAIPTFALVP
jgi:hypothetical protein